MTEWLATEGHEVNRKRVSRLIEAVYPKPKLSQPGLGPRTTLAVFEGHDLADDKPIEQHPDGGELEFDAGRGYAI